ncbi:hypothetical protein BGZ50_008615 [Haplosporangium sp. Z 11]|nr:hypothetical protein BGZ50_008615 [Haplosporangium sp. Z 11]
MAEKRKEVRYIAQKFANAILADTSSYIISTDGLQALNAFLDELLFILIDGAKGLETSRIKSAVYQTFPTALGKNAIVEAELEAKSYLDMGGKDTCNHMSASGQSATSSIFNADSDETMVEQVFEQFRAKCQYYSKLGERLGSPAGNPNNAVVVPTLIAIYVTAVLEHVAEYVLQVASTIADRQDHADMVTVREVYVALQEDRQIENTFEIMILKSQLQKRFRNSLILPRTGSRPEEQQPAQVKRSGSWGKQLRLGNADKPKLDVQLPTDVEEDDIPFDPNRPQFGDWDMPPDEESKLKKKNDFEMLFSSGETMKVSLTPNRLRTIEVHRKTAGMGGAVATRSSSRAASVLGGREGKSHGRRPSHGATAASNNGGANGGRKNSHAQSTPDANAPPLPAAPSVPAIPANFGVSQPILKKGQLVDQPPISPMQQQQIKQNQQQSEYHGLGIANTSGKAGKQQDSKMEDVRISTSTFESQLTLSTAEASTMSPLSPVASRSPVSPTGLRNSDGSLKATTQATSDLVTFLGNTSPQSSYLEQSQQGEPPMTPTSENGSITVSAKKENPIKSFMGRLGRNSQRISMDSSNSNVASSPTSVRSFTITQQPSESRSGSISGSTNGSIYSSHSGQASVLAPASATPPSIHMERRGSGQNVHDAIHQQYQQQQQQPQPQPSAYPSSRVLAQDSRSNFVINSGFPLPPDSSNATTNNGSISNKNAYVPPPQTLNTSAASQSSLANQQRPMSPDAGGFPIPSRNASLNHEVTSPTKTTSTSNYDARNGLEAGLPRPLSPRPQSPRSISPRPKSPLQSSFANHNNRNNGNNNSSSNSSGAAGNATESGILSPSPLSHSMVSSGSSSSSPSSSSTSLITYGKVQHIQDKLSKTAKAPSHGFKSQEHLQNLPTRISLEGTIRANPFYQQDRNASVRSSLHVDGSSTPPSTHPSEISTLRGVSAALGAASIHARNSGLPTSTAASATRAALTPPTSTSTTSTTTPGSVSSGSESGRDREDEDERRGLRSSKDDLVSPATSPEMGTLKGRLPSATTRTLTAAAAAAATALAAKQQQHQLSTEEGEEPISPTTKRSSVVSVNGAANRQFHVYGEEKAAVDEGEEEEEEIPYVVPVPRSTAPRVNSVMNRHSIFVDEAAQAMDALSRARHRQSMRLENGEDDLEDDDEDEDEDDEDEDEDYDMNHGIQPPEKWHYSDLEDEDDDEEYDDDEGEYSVDGERRVRRKHESFVSAKSVLMPNGSTVSLVDAYADQDSDDTQDEDDNAEKDAKMQLVQSLEMQQQQDLISGDLTKSTDYMDLIPVGETGDDEDRNGEDEDESEDSEDLEDNDDEEGQDRRIYLQNLRAQKREARRLERLAAGKSEESRSRGKSKNAAGSHKVRKIPSLESTSTATTMVAGSVFEASFAGTKKKSLRKGNSKENLRNQHDRPQTPTTPVPTTQIIPLTPTDLVLIRQKLFAAGNFEASMRMLDTIFHAAMAKMVEGRERGVQTEPVNFGENDADHEGDKVHEAVQKKKGVSTSTATTTTTTTSTSTTTTSTDEDKNTTTSMSQKQPHWVTVAVEKPVASIEDDDDEDRVVEWLLGGV